MKKSGFGNGINDHAGVSSSSLSSGGCVASAGKKTTDALHLNFILRYMWLFYFRIRCGSVVHIESISGWVLHSQANWGLLTLNSHCFYAQSWNSFASLTQMLFVQNLTAHQEAVQENPKLLHPYDRASETFFAVGAMSIAVPCSFFMFFSHSVLCWRTVSYETKRLLESISLIKFSLKKHSALRKCWLTIADLMYCFILFFY